MSEFPDDGVTGKLPMHTRGRKESSSSPRCWQTASKPCSAYDAKRIGRTQPAYWSFIGLCRDNGIAVLDAGGTNLCESVMGGVNGMLAEMDRDATVARLQAGKKHWRGVKRVEGRHPYGQHPSRDYDAERGIVARISEMKANDTSSYAIARTLNAEGTRTRYGKEFTTQTIQNILRRPGS